MKNNLRHTLIIVLIVTFTEGYAQMKSGYMIGLNLSAMTYRLKGEDLVPETWPGIHFGALFEVPVTRTFALQSGALFSAKCTGYEINGGQYSFSPIFIEVPVRAALNFGSAAFKISLYSGPYFAIGIDGLMIEPTGTTSMKFGSGYNHQMKPFDMGINIGAGMNIHGLLITCQYGYGFMNLAPVISDDSEMRNRVWGISFASSFPARR